MQIYDGYEVTAETLDEVRADLPVDQREEVEIGSILNRWTIEPKMRNSESITVWQESGRAAYHNGSNSEWGDWRRGRLHTDDGRIIDANGEEIDQ